MTTEFNILNHPWPLPERAAAPTPREQFEAQALVLAVKHYGYEPSDALLKSILERRANDRYMVPWVDGAWIGWQSAIEAVEGMSVITIDPPDLSGFEDRIKALIEKASHQVNPRQFMVVLPKGGSMWDDEPVEIKRSDAVTAIEAAGGTVKGKS
jgi:hypothetical protein